MQYAAWVGQILQGNFGMSLRNNEPVLGTIMRRLPLTAELALLSVALSAIVAIPLGVLSAMRRNSLLDFVVRLVAMVGLSVPNFWLAAMLLLVMGIVFHWQPSLRLVPFWEDPLTNLEQLAMPTVALSLAAMAVVMRMTRSSMLEVLGQDFIRVARAKGLATRAVLLRHALRNALIPIVTVLGLQMGFLLGGVVITEQIFGLPGLGWTLLNGVYQRDYPVVQGTVMVFAATFVLVNLAVDLVYTYLDPRIRYE